MVTSAGSVPRRSTTSRRLPAALRTAGVQRAVHSPMVRGVFFSLLGVGIFLVMVLQAGVIPAAAYAPVVIIAALYLRPRWMAVVSVTYALELVAYIIAISFLPRQVNLALWISVIANLVVIALSYVASTSRARIGVEGHRGESMFVDLRDRLRAFGVLPALPDGWHAESAVESAYGQSFSGDFVVATRARNGQLLEITLVDVSGKGVQAGTRALLLSGALGGLLGETLPDRFLGAANSYLVRQAWDEGFATAVHVSIDLTTGDYTVGTAGHPAAVQYHSGSGRWAMLEQTTGPVLGVVEEAPFMRTRGTIARGDAIVLYTDGVIETRHRDLTVGVDRMLGIAERLVSRGFHGGAARLCASAKAGETDDRAVVMVWRD
ncbi:MAG: PP2C family protein-serine/threonine phosphatase [Lapillicoccus sp.]